MTTDAGTVRLRVARGSLKGAVVLGDGASPEGTVVSFLPQAGQPEFGSVIVGASGTYSATGLATGSYRVRASRQEYVPAYSELQTVTAALTSEVPPLELSDGSAVVTRRVDNGEDPRFARVRDVSIVLATFGALMKQMRVSEDASFRDAARGDLTPRAYAAETAFQLGDVDGEHRIFAAFRDQFDLDTRPTRPSCSSTA